MDHLSAYPRINSASVVRELLCGQGITGRDRAKFKDAFFAFDRVTQLYRYEDIAFAGSLASGSIWMRSMQFMASNYDGEAKSDPDEGQTRLVTSEAYLTPSKGIDLGGLRVSGNSRGMILANCRMQTIASPYTYCFCLSTRCSHHLGERFYKNGCFITQINMPAIELVLLIRTAILNEGLPLTNLAAGHVFYSPSKTQRICRSTGVAGTLLKHTKFSVESEYRVLATFSESVGDNGTLKLQLQWPKIPAMLPVDGAARWSRPYWFFKHLHLERITCCWFREL